MLFSLCHFTFGRHSSNKAVRPPVRFFPQQFMIFDDRFECNDLLSSIDQGTEPILGIFRPVQILNELSCVCIPNLIGNRFSGGDVS